MKIILTCGHPFSGIEQTERILSTAGVKPAEPSRRETLSPHELQSKIASTYKINLLSGSPMEQLAPGRMWQELAVDLFMANQNTELWGWTDPQTVYLLDFWQKFDPQIRFVLVYTSPEDTVGQLLHNSKPTVETDAALASWITINNHILSFYNRHQDRCLLINAAVLSSDPGCFTEKMAAHFEIDLHTDIAELYLPQHGDSAVATLLAKSLVEDCDEARSLYLELESSADIGLVSSKSTEQEKYCAWQEYVGLIEDRDQQAALLVETQCKLELLTKAKEIAEKLAEDKLQTDVGNLKNINSSITRENESLLLQLHKTQEDLENNFILNQELTNYKQQSIQQLEQLTKTKNEASKLAEDRKTLLEVATKEKVQLLEAHDKQAKLATDKAQADIEKLKSITASTTQENELLLLQLHQVQEELEHYFILYQELTIAQQQSIQQPVVLSDKLIIDLKGTFDGENWYYAETDGRWAGPDTTSSIKIPKLMPGDYELELDIVEAMSPEILNKMKLCLNGIPIKIDRPNGIVSTFINIFGKQKCYPVTVKARFKCKTSEADSAHELQFRFPKVVSPAERGSDDKRNLAIRLRSVKVTRTL